MFFLVGGGRGPKETQRLTMSSPLNNRYFFSYGFKNKKNQIAIGKPQKSIILVAVRLKDFFIYFFLICSRWKIKYLLF